MAQTQEVEIDYDLKGLCDFFLRKYNPTRQGLHDLEFFRELRSSSYWEAYVFFRRFLLEAFEVRNFSEVRDKWLATGEKERKKFSNNFVKKIAAYYGYCPLEIDLDDGWDNDDLRNYVAQLPVTRGEREYVQRILDNFYLLLYETGGPDGVLAKYSGELILSTGLREISQDCIANLFIVLFAEISENVLERKRILFAEALIMVSYCDDIARYGQYIHSNQNGVLNHVLHTLGRIFDFNNYPMVKQHWLTHYDSDGFVVKAELVSPEIEAAEPIIFDQWYDEQSGRMRCVRLTARYKPIYRAVGKANRKNLPLSEVSDTYGLAFWAPTKEDLDAAVAFMCQRLKDIPGVKITPDQQTSFLDKVKTRLGDSSQVGCIKLKIEWLMPSGHSAIIELQGYCCQYGRPLYINDPELCHSSYEVGRAMVLAADLFRYLDINWPDRKKRLNEKICFSKVNKT